MLPEYLQNFKDNIDQPNTVMLYKLKWTQLASIVDVKKMQILDFGSGFGTTANYLAKNNHVIAIEPRIDMIEERECENEYTQIQGNYTKLKDFDDCTFDIIICHNVLEFADERDVIVREFSRLLKVGGTLSIVKNNSAGRIIEFILTNKIDEAEHLLKGGCNSNIFGNVNLYTPDDLVAWGNNLKIEQILGLRTFFALQQGEEMKLDPKFISKMFDIEMELCNIEPYKSFSVFHHVLLRKY
jgi:SAM-dependent methyltransferase